MTIYIHELANNGWVNINVMKEPLFFNLTDVYPDHELAQLHVAGNVHIYLRRKEKAK
jgi:hypothetical protein